MMILKKTVYTTLYTFKVRHFEYGPAFSLEMTIHMVQHDKTGAVYPHTETKVFTPNDFLDYIESAEEFIELFEDDEEMYHWLTHFLDDKGWKNEVPIL